MADKSKLVDALINYVEMPGRQLNAFFGAKPKASPLAAAKALKQMGGDVLGSIQSAYTAPGRALSGQLRPQLMMDENGNLIQDETNMAKEASNFAMNVAGGGLGSTIAKPVQGGANTLGMFVGRKGMERLGLNDVLSHAEKLKSRWVPDEQIWAETAKMAADKGIRGGGITFQFGNEPHFEISDDLAKVNPMIKSDWNYETLPNILEHPDLYTAEPSLKSTVIQPSEQEHSHYSPSERSIYIGKAHRADISDILPFGDNQVQYKFNPDVVGHEANHVIQFKQNLPQGGSQDTKDILNKLFKEQEYQYAPNFERIANESPALQNLYRQSAIQDFSRILNKSSYKPRDLYGRGDWYKYSNDIHRELGMMPKKPGYERDNYIRNAHQILFDKYIQEKGITQDDIAEALNKTQNQTKYQINKIYKKLEPDYEATREFSKLKEKNYEMNQLNPFQVYDRLTGEATSRLVQDRWNFTPEERAASYPKPLLMDKSKQIKPWELIDVYYE